MHARRKAAAVVRGDDVLQKLFKELAERYKDRDGGYTRILRTRQRLNDAAHMAYIECVPDYPTRPGITESLADSIASQFWNSQAELCSLACGQVPKADHFSDHVKPFTKRQSDRGWAVVAGMWTGTGS